MFTGLISDLGRIRALARGPDLRLEIATGYDAAALPLGASVACNGCCLTVVDRGADWFAVEVSAESLARTTIGGWRAGTPVNLERSLRLGDELGGHLVYGHVDGVAEVLEMQPEGGSTRFSFKPPAELLTFIAPKGSIALDGVSLTVNEVGAESFGVNIIPHTAAVTSFGSLRPGARVNLEIDMLARYLARLVGHEGKAIA